MAASEQGPEPIREAIQTTPALSVPGAAPRAPERDIPEVGPWRSTAFFGREVSERRRVPWFSATLAGVGLALCVWGTVAQVEPALVFGPVLLTWGVLFMLRTLRQTRFRFTEEGLSCNRPRVSVKYGDIEEVEAGRERKRGRFPIHVFHERGSLTISERMSCSCEELYEFLKSQPLGKRVEPEPPPLFAAFLKQQRMICSPHDILVLRAARKTPRGSFPVSMLLAVLGLALPTPLWFYLSTLRRTWDFFAPLGVTILLVCAVFAGLILLGHWLSRPRIKNWKKAILILTPEAIAMEQGDLRGELRWSELQSVTRGSDTSFALSTGTERGIYLKVQGAQILIADIYERPLDYIEDIIRGHWDR